MLILLKNVKKKSHPFKTYILLVFKYEILRLHDMLMFGMIKDD